MSGTKKGGQKARETIYQKHGKDFFKMIGRKGGKATGMKGFALNPAKAGIAGAKGGRKSKRGPSKVKS